MKNFLLLIFSETYSDSKMELNRLRLIFIWISFHLLFPEDTFPCTIRLLLLMESAKQNGKKAKRAASCTPQVWVKGENQIKSKNTTVCATHTFRKIFTWILLLLIFSSNFHQTLNIENKIRKTHY